MGNPAIFNSCTSNKTGRWVATELHRHQQGSIIWSIWHVIMFLHLRPHPFHFQFYQCLILFLILIHSCCHHVLLIHDRPIHLIPTTSLFSSTIFLTDFISSVIPHIWLAIWCSREREFFFVTHHSVNNCPPLILSPTWSCSISHLSNVSFVKTVSGCLIPFCFMESYLIQLTNWRHDSLLKEIIMKKSFLQLQVLPYPQDSNGSAKHLRFLLPTIWIGL